MSYEEAARCIPATLEEAMEKAFWKWAGRSAIGACCPETWQAVAAAARDFLAAAGARV